MRRISGVARNLCFMERISACSADGSDIFLSNIRFDADHKIIAFVAHAFDDIAVFVEVFAVAGAVDAAVFGIGCYVFIRH